MATAPSWQLTYEDLASFPEDGRRHELIDGEHHVTPAPTLRHQRVVLVLGSALLELARSSRSGEAFAAPVDVVLSDIDVVRPDLVWVSSSRAEILTDANIQGAPDLVVEVLSPGTRRVDELTKRKLYERHGVLEYWIVDPELGRIRVLRREGEGFGPATELDVEAEQSLTSPLLPGFELALATIFA